MSLTILGAEVFDPALSGEYDLPVRLEIMVESLPDQPTHVELDVGPFQIMHYHWLKSIYTEGMLPSEWNDEDTQLNAATFNSSAYTVERECYVPVTVATEDSTGSIWQDFYMPIKRAQRILNRLERNQGSRGYDLVPDPTFVSEKKIAWMYQHPSRVCVVCAQMAAEAADGKPLRLVDLPTQGSLVQVLPHRVVSMCPQHVREWNRDSKDQRQSRS